VENIPINERVQYDDLLSQPLGAPPFVSKPPKGPGRKWTQEEALAEIKTPLRGRNFASGRNLFHAASCAKCHRLAGEGGAIGPDLSTAGRKFSLPDMLDAILEPSKAISDQYGSYLVLTEDGEQLNGRLVEVGDDYFVYTQDPDAKPRQFKKDEVQVKPSTISQMPVGLVDALNEEELKDLIAYIQAAGNKKAAQFRK
jgi:putative heme-binding domain-containing protein